MKTTILMTTAAAALLPTSGAALAETLKNVAPERAPGAQRNTPAEKIAPPMHAGERKAPETTGQASSDLKFGGRETTGGSPQTLSPGQGGNTRLNGTVGAGIHADESGAKAGIHTDLKSDADMKIGEKSGASAKSGQATTGQSKATVGQGAAAGSAKLSSQQRSQITTIIRKEDVARVRPAEINVSIRVGARIPSDVHFYPLPARVVEVHPAWEGYDYILVGSQILIIDPETREVVAILVA